MGNKVSVPNFNLSRRRRNDSTDYYIIKVNDVQIDRIQQMHHILKTCCEGNFYSPISKKLSRGIKVLDVGSGPGTWIFDMSSEYPKSEFIGIEVQEFMLPTIHPSNTKFIHNNVLEGLPFSPNSFDYIHMRCMILCFTEQQYEQILSDLLVLLKPNGYLELCEIQLCSTNMGPYSEILSTEMGKLLKSRSLNPFMNEQLGELLSRFGLQEVDQQEVEIPMCELDGKIAGLYGETLISAVYALKDALMKQMKMSKNAMDTLLTDYHHELKTRRMYSKYTRVYGRKSIKQQ